MKEAHPPLFTGNLCQACHVLRPLDLPERHSSAQLCLPPTGKLRLKNAVQLAHATQLRHDDPSPTPLTQQRGLHQAGPVLAARARAQEPGCPAGVASGRLWVQGWCGRGGLNSLLSPLGAASTHPSASAHSTARTGHRGGSRKTDLTCPSCLREHSSPERTLSTAWRPAATMPARAVGKETEARRPSQQQAEAASGSLSGDSYPPATLACGMRGVMFAEGQRRGCLSRSVS